MNLDLFSAPGPPPLHYVVQAARPHLESVSAPKVAYLTFFTPHAPNPFWLEYTHNAFRGLAEVTEISHRHQSHAEMVRGMEEATVIYCPGGNTYLLSERLHELKLYEPLQAAILAGKAYVGFSAGAVITGKTILTSGDMNVVGTSHLAGMGWLPCAIAVHFKAAIPTRTAEWDENIADYHHFHDHAVIALEDDAHLRLRGDRFTLERGTAWLYRPTLPRIPLHHGIISL